MAAILARSQCVNGSWAHEKGSWAHEKVKVPMNESTRKQIKFRKSAIPEIS